MLTNIILTVIIVAIVAAIVFYLIRQKKRGVTCIGCPHAKSCHGKCDSYKEK